MSLNVNRRIPYGKSFIPGARWMIFTIPTKKNKNQFASVSPG
jgi:hypothetical protein